MANSSVEGALWYETQSVLRSRESRYKVGRLLMMGYEVEIVSGGDRWKSWSMRREGIEMRQPSCRCIIFRSILESWNP